MEARKEDDRILGQKCKCAERKNNRREDERRLPCAKVDWKSCCEAAMVESW